MKEGKGKKKDKKKDRIVIANVAPLPTRQQSGILCRIRSADACAARDARNSTPRGRGTRMPTTIARANGCSPPPSPPCHVPCARSHVRVGMQQMMATTTRPGYSHVTMVGGGERVSTFARKKKQKNDTTPFTRPAFALFLHPLLCSARLGHGCRDGRCQCRCRCRSGARGAAAERFQMRHKALAVERALKAHREVVAVRDDSGEARGGK